MNRTARDFSEKNCGQCTARKAASKPSKRSLKDNQKVKLTARQIAAKKKYPRRLYFTITTTDLLAAVDKALSSE